MKRTFIAVICAVLSLVTVMCSPVEKVSRITVHITDGNTKEHPVLYLTDGSEIKMELSPEGIAVAEISNDVSVYAELGYKYSTRLMWIEPGADVKMSFSSEKFYDNVSFEGSSSDVNTFINGNVYRYATIDDTKKGEQEFICYADSLLKENRRKLEETSLPKSFKERESLRLAYYTFQTLPSYGHYHPRIGKEPDYKETELYWNKLSELYIYDGELLQFPDYQEFVADAFSLLSKREFSDLKGVERLVAYIEKYVPDTAIAEFLVNRRATAFINRNGLDNADGYLEAFSKYVKDEVMIKNMDLLIQKKSKCSVGALSPDFKATDVDGKEYTLADFRGKYIYIDIWATWCGPCRKEVPHLMELEHRFKDSGIYFVGLSCDNNRAAWEKCVRNGEVEGIQLYLEPDCTFMEDYSVAGIPRFILLDKEGRIINQKMSVPSDPKTAEALEKLVVNK